MSDSFDNTLVFNQTGLVRIYLFHYPLTPYPAFSHLITPSNTGRDDATQRRVNMGWLPNIPGHVRLQPNRQPKKPHRQPTLGIPAHIQSEGTYYVVTLTTPSRLVSCSKCTPCQAFTTSRITARSGPR